MNNDFDNSIFNRITELISLLSCENMTAARIAQITETAPEQTRMDLALLHRCGIRLYPEEILSAFDQNSSRYDHEILSLDTAIPTDQEYSEGLHCKRHGRRDGDPRAHCHNSCKQSDQRIIRCAESASYL